MKHPGPTRQSLIGRTEMIPPYASYLWEAAVPPHRLRGPQEVCMEVYSPPRVIPFLGELGFPGGLSADLLTGWNFIKADTRSALVIEVNVRRPQVLIVPPP